MKPKSQLYQEYLERKEYERDRRNMIRGTLENLLIENDEFIRIAHLYESEKAIEELVDNAEGYLEDWELEYTDENIIEALKYKIWGDK